MPDGYPILNLHEGILTSKYASQVSYGPVFNNLWYDPAYGEIKNQLIFESFNDHVMKTTGVESRRIAPM